MGKLMDTRKIGWVDGWVDGNMDEWRDEYVSGWMDE